MTVTISKPKASASPNFSFLSAYDRSLLDATAAAERYVFDDPVTALMRLRQFGEMLAEEACASLGLYTNPEDNQVDRLRRLRDRGVISQEITVSL
jgi:type I restriction enzyme R subunit